MTQNCVGYSQNQVLKLIVGHDETSFFCILKCKVRLRTSRKKIQVFWDLFKHPWRRFLWNKITAFSYYLFWEGTKYASAKKIFVRFWSFSGSNFPAFGLNREIYSVSLRIQSECRKIRTRKTPNTDTSHTVSLRLSNKFFLQTKQVTEEFTWRCSIKKVSACNFFKKRLQYRCFFLWFLQKLSEQAF